MLVGAGGWLNKQTKNLVLCGYNTGMHMLVAVGGNLLAEA